MYVAITVKTGLTDPDNVVKKTVKYLEKNKCKVDLCPGTCVLVPNRKPGLDFHNPYDLIISFGGDGTLLRTVQYMKNFDSMVLSINMGRLGFFSEGVGKHFEKILDKVLKKKYYIDKRMLARCTVLRGKRRAFTQRALNEVTIARDALARMVPLRTTVDDLKLTTFMADGLIVSTPTGSTGYSLSAGGPVVSPKVDCLILTPIAPHSFTQKPIVLPPTSRVKVSMSNSQGRTYLTMDGQTGFHLKDNDVVKIKRSTKTLKLVRLSKNSYYQTLRTKLHWGGDLSGR
ncbi:MAG: NAD(+)/NADH kinase [Candidatus Gracilibacteria bacterium]|nr:NAD(+)/NADH kinase [Candidatus Gracilibacteria bacterium]